MIPSLAFVVGAQKRILFTLAALWLTGHCFAQTAAFTSDITSGCFPITVTFQDLSAGAPTSWDWDFGNGNDSKLQNPIATYTAPGTYNVTLRVSGGSVSVRTAYIHVYDYPTASFTSLAPPVGCTPLKVDFRDTSTPGSGSVNSWVWTFGDGGSSTERNPTYTYTTPGTRPVTLRVTNQYGCVKSSNQVFMAEARGPNASFTVDNDVFCQVPATVKFTDKTTGAAPFTYSWDFKDNSGLSTQASPTRTFAKAGAYAVTLHAFDANGCEGTSTKVINVGSESGLTVTPSATKVCVEQELTFTALVTTPATTWDWRFGNGATSKVQDPGPIAYKTAGTYTVRTEAQLVGKACSSVVTNIIEVVADPVPNFTTTVDCNHKVTFTNKSTKFARVEWFLDGVLYSTANSFSYTYSGPGDYGVRLVAYNSLDCSKELISGVQVPAKPMAIFTPNKTQSCDENSLSGCAPFTVNFEDVSINAAGHTAQWSFGDNTTSTSKKPIHTFGKGTYAVTLTIRTPDGCTSSTSAAVVVADLKPEADFTLAKTKACVREDIQFTSTSKNATYVCWNFGDGNVGTGNIVSTSYLKPGTYTVTMTAKNAGCSDTETKVDVITIGDPYLEYEIEKNCTDPYSITIKDNSDHDKVDSKTWDFGDGIVETGNVSHHRYTKTGQYEIKLTGTNNAANCSVVIPTTIAIRDVKADFTIDNPKPCKKADVLFKSTSTDAGELTWIFGNGKYSSGEVATTYYEEHGNFDVTLKATDRDGCYALKTLRVSVLDLGGDFNFTASGVSCNALDVQFTDASVATPSVDSWEWDFGDGNTATDANPLHTYTQQGRYPVKLTLTNADGQCSFIQYDAVVFINPKADFTTSTEDFGFCIDSDIQLVNKSENASTQHWSFSAGPPSTEVHPVISYSNTGRYTVTLDVEDNYGCKKTFSRDIDITKPTADFTAKNIFTECPDPALLSTFTDASQGDVKKWEWDFGNGQIQTHENRAPGEDYFYSYSRPGIYDITLFATDAYGCRDTVTYDALVHVGGPDATFEDDKLGKVCVLDSIGFIATPLNNSVKIYRWDFGDGNGVDLTEPTTGHAYTYTGSRTVFLTLFDDNNCKVSSLSSVTVSVSDSSLIEFDYGPRCIFEGESFTVTAASEDPDLTWSWEVGDTPAGTGPEAIILQETHGNYPVKLHAVNAAGCTSTVMAEVPVRAGLSMIPNIFTPNGDGINETFELDGLELSAWDLIVYNRWGNTVYKKKQYNNDWTGGGLSSGVYFYTVTNAFCSDRNYKGTVTISK
jgi:gliding motility-associated-like protein